MDLVNVLVSGLVGAGGAGGLALLLKARSESRKVDADSAAILSSAAVKMLQPLHDEIALLRDEVRELRHEVAEYHRLYGPLGPIPAPR